MILYPERRPTVLMRTDPFRELDRFAQQVIGTPARPAAMPIDAFRSNEHFVVQFDLPGFAADSIDLTVEKNVLTVHASRTRTQDEKVEMVLAERPHGTFSRQLFLGDTLDADKIDASYADGVLTLRIPVAEKAKPRKVLINAEGQAPAAIEAESREPALASA